MPESKVITLSVPSRTDGYFTVHVRAGPLPFGSKVEILSGQGAALGTIAPFGRTAYQTGGSYTIRIPAPAAGEVLQMHCILKIPGLPPRAPTDQEITGAEITPSN